MAGLGGIQTSVNEIPGVAVEGDFCSLNPRANTLAGPGAFVAGAAGVTIGRFAWAYAPVDPNGASQIVLNTGTGLPSGFIANAQQGLNTVYLSDASLFIPQGFAVSLFDECEVWVKNTGAGQALSGQKCYANFADGKSTFAATATPTGGGSGSASTIAEETASVTASISNNIMTVTAVGSGTLYTGSALSGSGVASGTVLGAQLTPLLSGETTGGVGRYYVSIPEQSVSSTTVTAEYGLLTVGGTVVPGFAIGDVLTGTDVLTGSTITALGTGTGATGTYITQYQTVDSTAISVSALNVETNYYARSSGLAGELVKISKRTLS